MSSNHTPPPPTELTNDRGHTADKLRECRGHRLSVLTTGQSSQNPHTATATDSVISLPIQKQKRNFI